MKRRHDRGMVLMAVLFFVLLSSATVATFLARATVDGFAAQNRDGAARAEALARGGVRLAVAALLTDRLRESEQEFAADTAQDGWAQLSGLPFELPDGGLLRVRVEDAGAKLSLNALFAEGAPRDVTSEIFLGELLTKVIDEIPVRPEQKLYDVEALARNLIDWVDVDDVRVAGGAEDDYYQAQRPAYRAANRPLLSLEELLLVEGFDAQLVNALRPYVDVQPLVKADGVNPNTAPDWVLALLYHGVAGSQRLADEDTVRRILDIREQKGILCADEANNPACTPLREAIDGEVFPPPTYHSDVFRVTAEARYGEVRRTVEAVVDRSNAESPEVLAWRVW
ncbi:MAG: type II secretion system minor pseudopilin GspK [Myxococcota bacterium]